MRLILLSDLHGELPKDVPECDTVVISGDICPNYNVSVEEKEVNLQKQWLFNVFLPWAICLPCKNVVFTWGNHDIIGESQEGLLNFSLSMTIDKDGVRVKNVVLLNDLSMELDGIKFYGSPWSITYKGKWAFNATDEQLEKVWDKIPLDTDVLLVHSPIYSIGDLTLNTGENVGSKTLLKRVKEVNPKLVVFGHIHEGRGIYKLRNTVVANASHLDASYIARKDFLVWDLKWPVL